MSAADLTPAEAAALAAIEALSADGWAPSYDDIRVRLGYASCSSVHRIVRRLEALGRIERRPHKARAIRLIGTGCAAGTA